MKHYRLLLLALALFLGTASTGAQGEAKATLYVREEGQLVRAAIEVEMKPGWHIYHEEIHGHPEAVGMPTSVELGGNVQWGAVRFPEPHEIGQGFDDAQGNEVTILAHEGTIVLFAAGVLAEGATEADAKATIRGQVCKQSCIPFNEELTTKFKGPDDLFADFPADLMPRQTGSEGAAEEAQEPAVPVPTQDEHVSGRADATLWSRVVDRRVQVAIQIKIAPKWHLYHEELGHPEAMGKPTVVTLHGEGVAWDRVVFPEPHQFGQGLDGMDGEEIWIWGHEGTITLFAQGNLEAGATGEGIWAELKGQTCEELCINYAETAVSRGAGPDGVFDGIDAALSGSGGSHGSVDAAPEDDGEGSEGLLDFLLLAVLGGLFALVMPCTYPMIPITISFFTKQAESRGGRVLPLSLAYGAGIILIFVLIGVIFGPLIIRFATHPITNLVIGVAFLYFAFVLFGMINLQPPRFLMNAAGQASMKGGFVGVFLMGATLVVTSFTCTAPFVGTLLSYGAVEGGSVGRIAMGMGVFGLTMAIPFVFLSLVPGRIQAMPKSGEWMNTVKCFLGFVEFAAALKFFSNTELVWDLQILSRELFLLLWAVIFVGGALYLFGIVRFKGAKPTIGPMRTIWGVLSLLLALYCGWGMLGNKMDRVMTAIAPNYSGGRFMPEWYVTGGEWRIVKDDYDQAVEVAHSEDKLLLVNFTGIT